MKRITYITSDTCQPCKSLKPRLTKLCADLGVRIDTLNIDRPEDHAVLQGLHVMAVPTLFVGEQRIEPAQARIRNIEGIIKGELL